MEPVKDKMVAAWKSAARALSIGFQTPFELHRGEEVISCAGLIPNFGSSKGTVIVSRRDPDPESALEAAEALGYNAPGLSPFYYERYSRERFIETLTDWGWYGPPDSRPAWLGKPLKVGTGLASRERRARTVTKLRRKRP